MDKAFEVKKYSISSLEKIIANNTDAPYHVIKRKAHFHYFDGYFSYLKAATIVVEYNYIDRDFLEDYEGYYARCFSKYRRKCVRLHFFSIEFTKEQLLKLISKSKTDLSEKTLQGSYLGFVVLKHLPNRFIGRTCLTTYDSIQSDRYFPILRKYEASLFGIKLIIDTIAFQEQDKAVAACATSALWSAFQGTGKLFQLPIPSPVEITKAVREHHSESRLLPNNGLTLQQIATAIRSFGLEPTIFPTVSPLELKGIIQSYVKGKIPLILTLRIVEKKLPHKHIGFHAVAITGYSLGLQDPTPTDDGVFFTSSKINKLYAHDDQVGPFARMEFLKEITTSNGTENPLSTSWGSDINKRENYLAIPDNIIAPLYHKIRIPYDLIKYKIICFGMLVEIVRKELPISLNDSLQWDIRLTQLNEYKEQIRDEKNITIQHKQQILLKPFPRFIWVATAYHNSSKEIELLFDATDIDQGNSFLGSVEYNE